MWDIIRNGHSLDEFYTKNPNVLNWVYVSKRYSQERTLVMDNWRKLKGYGFKEFRSDSTKQDKGHFTQFKLLMDSIREGKSAIVPMADIINVTRASFAAIESLKEGRWVEVD